MSERGAARARIGVTALATMVLATTLGGCAHATRPEAAAPAAVTRDHAIAHGRVTIAPSLHRSDAQGPMVIGFLTAREHAELVTERRMSMGTIAALLYDRVEAIRAADLRAPDASVTFALDVPAGEEVIAFAVLPRGDAEWSDVLAGEGEGSFVGFANARSGAPIDLELRQRLGPSSPAPSLCEGARRALVVLDAPRLTEPRRRVCVVLPRSYQANGARRYPVIYLLPGFSGGEAAFLRPGRDIDAVADDVAAASGREAILVGVNTVTAYGSSYFSASALEGDFETFFLRDVIGAVDARYRTIAAPSARALLGQSTGGFNVVSLALRHPSSFAAVEAMSPDQLDFPSYFLDGDSQTGARAMKSARIREMRLDDAMGGAGQMTSYAAAWSPDRTAPRGFAWPADLTSGQVVPSVWARWLAASPAEMIRRPEVLAAVKAHLGGRIRITVARGDEFGLFEPARIFSEQLAAAGIAHEFVPTDGGHAIGIKERERAAIAHALARLLVATP